MIRLGASLCVWASVGTLAVSASCGAAQDHATTPSTGTTSTRGDAATKDGTAAEIETDTAGLDVGTPDCEPTTQSVRATIIEPLCATAGCHDAQVAAAGLDLTVDELASVLVGVASGTCPGEVLVVEGDATASFFVAKLRPSPACGDAMPVRGELSADAIACIEAWAAGLTLACETCGTTACLDLDTTADHCGDCGTACPSSTPCVGGTCACPKGTTPCRDACVEVNSDPEHCGQCGNACPPEGVCLTSACADDCGTLTKCGGACVDLENSLSHCGACSTTCDASEVCLDGTCGCQAESKSYAVDVEPILVAHCAMMGCHRSMGPNGGAEDLSLAMGSGFGELVGVASMQCADRLLVSPGAPGASYLVDKLNGVDLCAGTKMPKMGPGLNAAERQVVADWICSGAAP